MATISLENAISLEHLLKFVQAPYLLYKNSLSTFNDDEKKNSVFFLHALVGNDTTSADAEVTFGHSGQLTGNHKVGFLVSNNGIEYGSRFVDVYRSTKTEDGVTENYFNVAYIGDNGTIENESWGYLSVTQKAYNKAWKDHEDLFVKYFGGLGQSGLAGDSAEYTLDSPVGLPAAADVTGLVWKEFKHQKDLINQLSANDSAHLVDLMNQLIKNYNADAQLQAKLYALTPTEAHTEYVEIAADKVYTSWAALVAEVGHTISVEAGALGDIHRIDTNVLDLSTSIEHLEESMHETVEKLIDSSLLGNHVTATEADDLKSKYGIKSLDEPITGSPVLGVLPRVEALESHYAKETVREVNTDITAPVDYTNALNLNAEERKNVTDVTYKAGTNVELGVFFKDEHFDVTAIGGVNGVAIKQSTVESWIDDKINNNTLEFKVVREDDTADASAANSIVTYRLYSKATGAADDAWTPCAGSASIDIVKDFMLNGAAIVHKYEFSGVAKEVEESQLRLTADEAGSSKTWQQLIDEGVEYRKAAYMRLVFNIADTDTIVPGMPTTNVIDIPLKDLVEVYKVGDGTAEIYGLGDSSINSSTGRYLDITDYAIRFDMAQVVADISTLFQVGNNAKHDEIISRLNVIDGSTGGLTAVLTETQSDVDDLSTNRVATLEELTKEYIGYPVYDANNILTEFVDGSIVKYVRTQLIGDPTKEVTALTQSGATGGIYKYVNDKITTLTDTTNDLSSRMGDAEEYLDDVSSRLTDSVNNIEANISALMEQTTLHDASVVDLNEKMEAVLEMLSWHTIA